MKRHCKECDSVYTVTVSPQRYDHWLCPACKEALDLEAIRISTDCRTKRSGLRKGVK